MVVFVVVSVVVFALASVIAIVSMGVDTAIAFPVGAPRTMCSRRPDARPRDWWAGATAMTKSSQAGSGGPGVMIVLGEEQGEGEGVDGR